ncbi:unnamed protein product [Allacma fusca]|uniref:RPAP1/MINIYO-like TPR repeats domain-containing protein n=1 Tax=Allacma fusca TaxID=39272 RepID=A0A8J2JDK2_9HEXA|nr:unnamed protein product [Allacma fusca]
MIGGEPSVSDEHNQDDQGADVDTASRRRKGKSQKLTRDDILLQPSIQLLLRNILKLLLSLLEATFGKEPKPFTSFKPEPALEHVATFKDNSYGELIKEFESVSYCSNIFSAYLLLPLIPTESKETKLLLWSMQGLQFRLIPPDYLTTEVETDRALLQLYTILLVKTSTINRSSNELLFHVLHYHVTWGLRVEDMQTFTTLKSLHAQARDICGNNVYVEESAVQFGQYEYFCIFPHDGDNLIEAVGMFLASTEDNSKGKESDSGLPFVTACIVVAALNGFLWGLGTVLYLRYRQRFDHIYKFELHFSRMSSMILRLMIAGKGLEIATTSKLLEMATTNKVPEVATTNKVLEVSTTNKVLEVATTTMNTPEEFELSRSDPELQPDVHELSVHPTADFRSNYNFDLLPGFNECGLSWDMSQNKNQTIKKRIVGGKLAKLAKYPWLGRLELYEGPKLHLVQ